MHLRAAERRERGGASLISRRMIWKPTDNYKSICEQWEPGKRRELANPWKVRKRWKSKKNKKKSIRTNARGARWTSSRAGKGWTRPGRVGQGPEEPSRSVRDGQGQEGPARAKDEVRNPRRARQSPKGEVRMAEMAKRACDPQVRRPKVEKSLRGPGTNGENAKKLKKTIKNHNKPKETEMQKNQMQLMRKLLTF